MALTTAQALQGAALNGHLETVRLLISAGASASASNTLHSVRAQLHGPLARHLRRCGSALSCNGAQVHNAASNGHLEIVRFLLDHGGDKNAKVNFY